MSLVLSLHFPSFPFCAFLLSFLALPRPVAGPAPLPSVLAGAEWGLHSRRGPGKIKCSDAPETDFSLQPANADGFLQDSPSSGAPKRRHVLARRDRRDGPQHLHFLGVLEGVWDVQLPREDALAKQGVQILLPPPGWDKDNTQPEVPSSSSPGAAEHGASSSPGRGHCSGRDELFSSGHSSRLPRSARVALLSCRQGCDQGKREKHSEGWREAVRIAPGRTEQRMLPVQACSQPGVTVGGVCARSRAAWDVTGATRDPSCSGLS